MNLLEPKGLAPSSNRTGIFRDTALSHIVIYEPYATGHRMNYVRWVTRSLLDQGRYEVTLLTKEESLKHPSVRALGEVFGDALRVKCMRAEAETSLAVARRWGHALSLLRQKIRAFCQFRRAIKDLHNEQGIDFLFIPYLDYVLHALAVFPGPLARIPWAGIAMRPRFHMRPMGVIATGIRYAALEKRFYRRLLKHPSLQKLFSLDPLFVEYVHDWQPTHLSKVAWLRDPVDMTVNQTREGARQALGICADDTVILVYGVLDRRKGVDLLLSVLDRTGLAIKVVVALIGAQSPDIVALMSEPVAKKMANGGRLIQINGFVSRLQEEQAFKAADIVWLGYRDFVWSSGVQVQAGSVGLPVISHNRGLIGHLTSRHGLGFAVDLDDAGAIDQALWRLVDDPGLRRKMGNAGRRYFSDHTPENFGDSVAKVIFQSLSEERPRS